VAVEVLAMATVTATATATGAAAVLAGLEADLVVAEMAIVAAGAVGLEVDLVIVAEMAVVVAGAAGLEVGLVMVAKMVAAATAAAGLEADLVVSEIVTVAPEAWNCCVREAGRRRLRVGQEDEGRRWGRQRGHRARHC